MIVLEGVRKSFGRVEALRGVSFEVALGLRTSAGEKKPLGGQALVRRPNATQETNNVKMGTIARVAVVGWLAAAVAGMASRNIAPRIEASGV